MAVPCIGGDLSIVQFPAMVGFGSAAFLTCAVPLANFAAMPVLVVGGTLLALRAQSAEAGASGATPS